MHKPRFFLALGSALLLSACGQQSDVEAGLASGADRYVVKPFTAATLDEKLNKIFEKMEKA